MSTSAEMMLLFAVQALRPARGDAAEQAANAKKMNMNFFPFFFLNFIFSNKVPHWNSTYILAKHSDAG